MPEKRRYETFEHALDQAVDMLTERFGTADQQAAISLAHVLYTVQERERFEERGREMDPPYSL